MRPLNAFIKGLSRSFPVALAAVGLILATHTGVMAANVTVKITFDSDNDVTGADDPLRVVIAALNFDQTKTITDALEPSAVVITLPAGVTFNNPVHYHIFDPGDGTKFGDELAAGNPGGVGTVYYASDDQNGNLPIPPTWVDMISPQDKTISGSTLLTLTATVPEPSTWALLGTGAIGLLATVRQRRGQAPTSSA